MVMSVAMRVGMLPPVVRAVVVVPVAMLVRVIVPVAAGTIVIAAVVRVGAGHGVILSRRPQPWPALGTE